MFCSSFLLFSAVFQITYGWLDIALNEEPFVGPGVEIMFIVFDII